MKTYTFTLRCDCEGQTKTIVVIEKNIVSAINHLLLDCKQPDIVSVKFEKFEG